VGLTTRFSKPARSRTAELALFAATATSESGGVGRSADLRQCLGSELVEIEVLNGGQVIVDDLIREKVPYAFGLCGHGNIGFIDALPL
jgi:hypothetical protein